MNPIGTNSVLIAMIILMLQFPAITAWAAPAVSTFSPAEGAVVLPTTTIQATFNEPLDPTSVTSGSFSLNRNEKFTSIAAGGMHTVALKNDGTVVAGGIETGVWGKTCIARKSFLSALPASLPLLRVAFTPELSKTTAQ